MHEVTFFILKYEYLQIQSSPWVNVLHSTTVDSEHSSDIQMWVKLLCIIKMSVSVPPRQASD